MRRAQILALTFGLLLTLALSAGASAQGMIGLIEKANTKAGSEAQAATTSAEPTEAAMPADDQELEDIIERARELGTPVLLVPDAKEAAGDGEQEVAYAASMDDAVELRNEISETIQAAEETDTAIISTLESARGPERPGFGWMLPAFLLAVLALGVATFAWIGVKRWLRSYLRNMELDPARDRAALAGFVLYRLMTEWLALAAFALAGFAFIIVVSPESGPARWSAQVVIGAMAMFYFIRGLFSAVLSPRDPATRLVDLDSGTAQKMLARLTTIAAVGFTLVGLTAWLHGLGLPEQIGDFLRIIGALTVALMFTAFAIAHRRDVAGLIRGKSENPWLLRKIIASLWHILFIVYLFVTFALNVVRLVELEAGFRSGPILGPIFAALAGLVTFAIAIVIIDRQVKTRQAALAAASGGTARLADAVSPGPDGPIVPEETAEEARARSIEPLARWQLRWKAFADHVAGVSAVAVGFLVLLAVSGRVSVDSARMEWIGIAVIVFVTYVGYEAVKTWIDGTMEDEEGPPGAVDHEDGMGPGSSRLATLLPLLRNVLVITISLIIGMVVLSGMGVNVAPIFAGAGIVGLAVGFGAQSLIRDIFSGAFFLADDAFRRGEYIDVGGVTGSVERISLRSFQLRHHNGPLHTIPFGEIKRLTNFSRDWVVMKLKLRLQYGTDIENVRKIVKKLGQDLLADPEIGHLFLQPLKSQGVVEMEDSAMICRVKFMTKPGDQFLARRHVYARIHEAFEDAGIVFASRQVTVRVESDHPLSKDERDAALGGVQPVLAAASKT